jgi:hypothetical protein
MARISWERESSCTSDSDEEIERWQNRLHEVTTLNCNMMIRSLRCVTTEVRDLPMYDGLSEVDDFLNKFEREVPEQQRFDALKWVLRATPARWWGTHQRSFEDWRECRRMMCMWFGKASDVAKRQDQRSMGKSHNLSGCTCSVIPWMSYP